MYSLNLMMPLGFCAAFVLNLELAFLLVVTDSLNRLLAFLYCVGVRIKNLDDPSRYNTAEWALNLTLASFCLKIFVKNLATPSLYCVAVLNLKREEKSSNLCALVLNLDDPSLITVTDCLNLATAFFRTGTDCLNLVTAIW
jgi:hypothetical protein